MNSTDNSLFGVDFEIDEESSLYLGLGIGGAILLGMVIGGVALAIVLKQFLRK